MAFRRYRRGRTDSAFAIDRGRAGAGADAAEREIGIGGRGGRVAKLAIGRVAPPVLVAAAEQIEQDRRRHDRHARRSHGEAAALAPCSHACTPDAASRPNAEPPDERDGVDAFDRLRRIEQSGFARPRSAAAYVDRGDGGLVEHDRCHAGAEPQILGVADFYSRHVGDEIAQWCSVIPGRSASASPKSITTKLAIKTREFFRSAGITIPGRPLRPSRNDGVITSSRARYRGACAPRTTRPEAAGHRVRHACHHRRRACRRHAELSVALRAAAGAALSRLYDRHVAGAVCRCGARAAGSPRNRCGGAVVRARLLHGVRRAWRERKRCRRACCAPIRASSRWWQAWSLSSWACISWG